MVVDPAAPIPAPATTTLPYYQDNTTTTTTSVITRNNRNDHSDGTILESSSDTQSSEQESCFRYSYCCLCRPLRHCCRNCSISGGALNCLCLSSWSDRTLRRAVQGIFLLLGVGLLMPWNAFISAKPYFESRYCSTSSNAANNNTDTHARGYDGYVVDAVTEEDDDDADHHHHENLESAFALVYNLSAVAVLALIIASQWTRDRYRARRDAVAVAIVSELPDQIRRRDSFSSSSGNSNSSGSSRTGSTAASSSSANSGHSYWMVMIPLTLYTLVFLGQTLLVMCINIPAATFRRLTVASLAACGMSQALATAGIVATANLFDAATAISPFLAGQAFGGVAVALANWVAAMAEDPDPYWQSHCSDGNNTAAAVMSSALAHEIAVPYEFDYAMASEILGDRQISSSGATFSRQRQHHDDDRSYSSLSSYSSPSSCVPYRHMDTAIFLYFLAGTITLLVCVVGYIFVDYYSRTQHRDDYEAIADYNNDICNHNNNNTNSGNVHANVTTTGASAIEHGDDISALRNECVEKGSPRIGLEMPDALRRQRLEEEEDQGIQYNTDVPTNNTTTNNNGNNMNNEMSAVWTAVKGPALSILLVFFVTLSLFPAKTSELVSVHQCQDNNSNNVIHRLFNDLYVPTSFVIFNAGDLAGRLFAAQGIPTSLSNNKCFLQNNLSTTLVVAALLRFLFFPLIFLCNSNDNNNSNGILGGLQIKSDLFSVAVQFLFALTNGWIVSVAFMHARTLLPNTSRLQEASSEILNLCLSLGLLLGSLFSFPVSKI